MLFHTQPKAKGRLFPVPNGTVAIGGGWDSLRSQTTPSSHPAVPSPPATYKQFKYQTQKRGYTHACKNKTNLIKTMQKNPTFLHESCINKKINGYFNSQLFSTSP